jgi:hypothetical protein
MKPIPKQLTPLGTIPQRWTAATINFLTEDERRRLLDAIDSKRDYAIFLFAYRPAWAYGPRFPTALAWGSASV